MRAPARFKCVLIDSVDGLLWQLEGIPASAPLGASRASARSASMQCGTPMSRGCLRGCLVSAPAARRRVRCAVGLRRRRQVAAAADFSGLGPAELAASAQVSVFEDAAVAPLAGSEASTLFPVDAILDSSPDLDAARDVVSLPQSWDAFARLAESVTGVDVSSAAATEQADGFSMVTGLPGGDAVLPLLSLAYATARPGVLWGAIDAYLLAPLSTLLSPRIDGDEVKLLRRIGEGTFGSVYTGTYRGSIAIIAKKAKTGVDGAEQVQEAEAYFNARMMRSLARRSVAPFMGSYSLGGPPILVWADKGQATLADLLEDRNVLAVMEESLSIRDGSSLSDAARTNQIAKVVIRQLLSCVKDLHRDGIVHRDIKPANLVVMESRLRVIDFGAAADMRIGINYDPGRGLLDPFFAPPEQLVLPDTTPTPPPAPVAAVLSPFLWAAFRPDLFDTYSVGLILLQCCVPALRRRNTMGPLGTFQRSLAAADYDFRRWRTENTSSAIYDLSALDHGGGLAFDLVCGLVRRRNGARRGRLSAAQALLHPWLLL